MKASIYEAQENKIWKYRWEGTIQVKNRMIGGIPLDPKFIQGWIKKNLGQTNEEKIHEMVARTLEDRQALDRGTTIAVIEGNGHSVESDVALLDLEGVDAVVDDVAKLNLNGFRRDEQGLYHAAYCVKAAIKEAACVAVAAGNLPATGWGGNARKGVRSHLAEHLYVDMPNEACYFEREDGSPVLQADGVQTRFVSTFRGTGICHEEYVEQPVMSFTVKSDMDFLDDQWATLWITGQKQGIGSVRSQGYGVYNIVKFERVGQPSVKRTRKRVVAS